MSEKGSTTRQRPEIGWLERVLVGGLLLASTVVVRSYFYYFGTHSLQFPFIQVLQDPSLYPGDPFAATLSTYCSWYWVAVARLAFVPLPALLFALALLPSP